MHRSGYFALTVIMAVMAGDAIAQDVPGIEICTAEKAMDRRTSCLQSNVNFLQQSIGKLRLDQQQRLDAANRQIEALRASVTSLQAMVGELQAAQKTAGAKAAPAPATAAPATKETAK
jgi:hypothetical protein